MRPIKFREWETERKTIVYGTREDYDDSVGFRFEHEEGGECILMQYTGLEDKNGVEIYEGDIVKGQITLGYKRTGVIKFDTDAFCFVEFWKEGMLTMFEENPDRMTIYNGFGGLEIVGNIYENPELLG